MPAILDPAWSRRRHARLATLARLRRDRRAATLQTRVFGTCSHWQTCHHNYCARARAAQSLAREADDLVRRLVKGA